MSKAGGVERPIWQSLAGREWNNSAHRALPVPEENDGATSAIPCSQTAESKSLSG